MGTQNVPSGHPHSPRKEQVSQNSTRDTKQEIVDTQCTPPPLVVGQRLTSCVDERRQTTSHLKVQELTPRISWDIHMACAPILLKL